MDLCDPDEVSEVTAFWCRALFSMPGYEGNPYRRRQLVHQRQALPKAEQAKALARKVAAVHSQQLVGEAVVYEAEPIERAS